MIEHDPENVLKQSKKIPINQSNDDISKSVTKNNKSIPICNIVGSTKVRTNNYNQFVPTAAIAAKKNLIIVEFLKYLVSINIWKLYVWKVAYRSIFKEDRVEVTD